MARKRKIRKNSKLRAKKPIGPTVSLCMIVKDEEEFLARCLNSVKGVADEIIIVDTGSTDGTVDIAKSFGAKVYHHPWENDFSRHRNQSISYATKDWILILDADEELYHEDAPLLKSTLASTQADFLYLRCYDMEKSGRIHGVFNQIRLFRNRMGMLYTLAVHNQLETRGTGAYTSIRLRHYGYDLSREKMENKHRRTTSLLLNQLEKNPQEPYFYYQLAASYSMHREPDKAIQYGEKALELKRELALHNAYFVTVFYIVGQGYLTLGQMRKAEKIYREALRFFPNDLDACHALAAICFKKRDAIGCKRFSERYLRIHALFEQNPAEMKGIYFHSFDKKDEIYFGLGCISFLQGHPHKADKYFSSAFEYRNRPVQMARNVFNFYIEQRVPALALRWFKTIVGMSEVEQQLLEKFSRASSKVDGIETTIERFKELSLANSEKPEIWEVMGDLQVEAGKMSDAANSYRKALHLNPHSKEIYLKFIRACDASNNLKDALLAILKSLEIFPDDPQLKIIAGKVLIDMGNYKLAKQVIKSMPAHEVSSTNKNLRRLLTCKIAWAEGELDGFTNELEKIMRALDMSVNICIDSLEQLAQILLEISARFSKNQDWDSAEVSLSLASLVAPEYVAISSFDHFTKNMPDRLS